MLVKTLVTLLLLLGSSPAMAAATDIPGSGGVECSLSAEKAAVGALEPVWLNVDCENRGAAAYALLLGPGGPAGLRVLPSVAGKACWSSVFNDPFLSARPSVVEVPAHGKSSLRVPLNRWFRFPDAGRYSVTLIDCRGSRDGKDPGAGALSPAVSFEVLPLDGTRLAGACEQLVRDAASGDGEKSQEAAEALGLLDSPEAVPCLKKALAANDFASFFAVPGLARINTPETVRILIDAFDGANGFTRMRIREGLFQMKPRIDDPALRHRLDLILAWQPQIVE